MELNKIATVKTGLVISRKESKDPLNSVEYRQLNLKSITDSATINLSDTIPFYAMERLSSNYITQEGDVIVKTSEPYTAVYITEEYTELVIPSHFVIVRVDSSIVLPQYIAWYLNKDRIKKAFRMSCTGTLKQIKPTIIAKTEVKLPSLERQQMVVELNDITQREIMLLKKQLEQKEAYYKALINKVNRM